MQDRGLGAELPRLYEGLSNTFLAEELILGGSSTLFGLDTEIPPLTEDLDLLVSVDLVEAREDEILDLLHSLGYEHRPDSPTFISPRGNAFDLVGYARTDVPDHVGGGQRLKVMVFRDLSVLIRSPEAIVAAPGGLRALSPAAFCVVKLLTVRLEKGAKDKLQALLLMAERSNQPEFIEAFVRLMRTFEPGKTEDALPDAQAAALALHTDPTINSEDAYGYAAFHRQVQRGLELLKGLEERYVATG